MFRRAVLEALVAMCSDMLCQRSRWSRPCWIMREHSRSYWIMSEADEFAALNEDWLLLSGDEEVVGALSEWML